MWCCKKHVGTTPDVAKGSSAPNPLVRSRQCNVAKAHRHDARRCKKHHQHPTHNLDPDAVMLQKAHRHYTRCCKRLISTKPISYAPNRYDDAKSTSSPNPEVLFSSPTPPGFSVFFLTVSPSWIWTEVFQFSIPSDDYLVFPQMTRFMWSFDDIMTMSPVDVLAW